MQGEWEDAQIQFTKAISIDKHRPKYFFHRAQVWSNMDQFEAAIKDYRLTLEADNPTEDMQYKTRFYKGICLRKIKQTAKSIEELKIAVDKRPDEARAHNNLGLSYFEDEKWEEAYAEYVKAISHTNVDKKEKDEEKRKEAALHYNNKGMA